MSSTRSAAPLSDVPALAPQNPRLSHHPIPEEPEDESNNETGSESLEPITPTDGQFHHPFHHHDGSVDTQHFAPPPSVPNKTMPFQTPQPVNTRPQPPPLSTTSIKSPQTAELSSPTARNTLGKRVGSFVRNKLQRTNSKPIGETTPRPTLDTTNVPRTTVTPASAVIPRRLGSWSTKNSPETSASDSPPSPGSPVNTTTERKELKVDSDAQLQRRSMNLQAGSDPQQKKGWAFGKKDTDRPGRRRSASTDLTPRTQSKNSDDATIGLVDTFSKAAVEGTGLKARRISISLPDEFNVDHCELTKEFKSTSIVPGRRGKKLGFGATAVVRVMSRKGWGETDLVAVKEYRGREKDEDEEDYLNKIKSEFSIANSLHHPNIVSTIRLCTHNGKWNHVMEYCNHGELYALVERGLFKGFYNQKDRLCFFKQLLRAVDFLHEHGIAHRDIKLENILMDKDGHLKLSDFGVSDVFCGVHPGLRAAGGQCGKDMGEIRKCTPGICGSLPYIAPEVLAKEGEYDPRPLDVWSCAIVYLTMTLGGSPWEAAKPDHRFYARFKDGWDDWLEKKPDGIIKDGPDGIPMCGPLFNKIEPPSLRRLLLNMLYPDPNRRITMANVMKTNLVRNIECCTVESYEERKVSINAIAKNSAALAQRYTLKKHHHVPPKEVSKLRQNLSHRFDMGDG